MIRKTRIYRPGARKSSSKEHVWLQATLQNLAIDAAGVGVFGFLLRREFDTKSKAEGVVEQEEALGRLQVRLAVYTVPVEFYTILFQLQTRLKFL